MVTWPARVSKPVSVSDTAGGRADLRPSAGGVRGPRPAVVERDTGRGGAAGPRPAVPCAAHSRHTLTAVDTRDSEACPAGRPHCHNTDQTILPTDPAIDQRPAHLSNPPTRVAVCASAVYRSCFGSQLKPGVGVQCCGGDPHHVTESGRLVRPAGRQPRHRYTRVQHNINHPVR